MNVIKADILGYCFGVRKAVEKAENALENRGDNNVFSLGPLIHNKTTLTRLSEKGLLVAENLNSVPDGSTVIIRAHGVPPEIYSLMEEKHINVIDATCPRVKASQKIAEKHSGDNTEIIFTGDAEHGEVKGIAGFAGKNFHLIQNIRDLENLSLSSEGKIVLFSQTTFSGKEFEAIKNKISSDFSNVEVINTICPATQERQEALLQLCCKTDGVIVVGGKQSANTVRLYQTAKENCHYACHIESALEIPEEFYSLDKVGITAGASTPDEIIEDVVNRLKEKGK